MADTRRHAAPIWCLWILVFLFVFSLASAFAEGDGLLSNGDFAKGGSGWGLYKESGGSASFQAKDGKGELSINKAGQKDYSVQLYYDGFGLEKGGRYRLRFMVTSSIDRQILARIQKNGGDYFGYAIQDVALHANEEALVEFDFSMDQASDPAPRLCFNAGKPQDGPTYESHTLTFENVELMLIDGTGIEADAGKEESVSILVNQIGFLPDSPKTVFFRDGAIAGAFEVADLSGSVVFTGSQTDSVANSASGDTVSTGSFDALTTPGIYQVLSGGQISSAFQIGEKVYNECLQAALRFFYLQRCGMELTNDQAGPFAHPACHIGLATLYGTEEKKDVSGGWHDAGDYGRYVVPAAKTVADLLLAYEESPELFTDNAGIPESGNGSPDLLDEVRYELDWLKKMQDETTGGVYHKVTCAVFPGEIMPEQETEPLYLSPVSITATGDFAAVMALAARVYQDTDPAFSQTLLDAAQKAWAYLEANPDGGTGFHNPEGIVTGEYGDAYDLDERYWAAAELARTTQKDAYLQAASSLRAQSPRSGLGWQDVGTYGDIALLRAGETADTGLMETIKADLLHSAATLISDASQDGYQMTLGTDYPWGSNMTVANNGLLLMLAAAAAPEEADAFTRLATHHLDYLMGANAMGYCYITGFGALSPQSPHHRPSQAAMQAAPGMLAGGPNSRLEDPFAVTVLSGQPPAKCYADNSQSYSTNEVAIYWNSPLLLLMALLQK